MNTVNSAGDRILCLAVAIILVFVSGSIARAIMPFTTDGCSMFPDGTINDHTLWLECCVEHDKAYWKGGSYPDRVRADRALRDCVSASGAPFIAEIMLEGVRVGGSPFWPTTYRWGYGWPGLRGYRPLSAKEKEQVKAQLDEFEDNEIFYK